MIAFGYYLMKVIICSAILYSYYRIALHNKIFHHWNRFYLLFAVAVSVILPVIKINILQPALRNDSQVIRLFTVVNAGDEIVLAANRRVGFQIDSAEAISLLYILVSLFLLIFFLNSLFSIWKLIRRHESQKINRITFINTEANGTPFSFFNYIFWNRHIEIHSQSGQQIFRHELAHVNEKHSWDKLYMNAVLFAFWCNPIFWLIRKELNMIHEFIADSKALDQYDTSAFADMILQSAYPKQKFNLNNYFFYSPIKRRLLMLTKMQNPKVSYISRVLVLPLLTVIFFAFTLKTKHVQSNSDESAPIKLNRKITVVIDAGHGGDDNGAISKDGALEKNINLSIAKKVQELNKNENVTILLTRSKDVSMPISDRPSYAQQVKADAFISIHTNTTQSPQSDSSGFDVYISSRNQSIQSSSTLLGSLFITEMKGLYAISDQLRKRTEQKISVLDNPDINYAAILIECGYMTNPKDLHFIENQENQKQVARRILNAIEKFASTSTSQLMPSAAGNEASIDRKANESSANNSNQKEPPGIILTSGKQPGTSVPGNPLIILNGKEMRSNFQVNSIPSNSITDMQIISDAYAIEKYGEKGKYGAIIIKANITETDTLPKSKFPKNVLYVINGKEEHSLDSIKNLNPQDIESINVLKDEIAWKKYGAKGKNGVVEITTRKSKSTNPGTE